MEETPAATGDMEYNNMYGVGVGGECKLVLRAGHVSWLCSPDVFHRLLRAGHESRGLLRRHADAADVLGSADG